MSNCMEPQAHPDRCGCGFDVARLVEQQREQIDALRAENARLRHRCGMYGLELINSEERRLKAEQERAELRAELAALKAVPDGVEVVGVIDEDDEGCFVELMNDRSFRIGEKLVRQSDHLAALSAPAAGQDVSALVEALDYQLLFNAIADATSATTKSGINISVQIFKSSILAALAAHKAGGGGHE